MKLGKRVLLGIGCILLISISWIIAATAKSDSQKQAELMARAEEYLADEIYVRAAPLLEEAAGYSGDHTKECEELLKGVYLALIDQQGYGRKYTELLDKQMARDDAEPAVFQEAADYYFVTGKTSKGLEVLREGIAKTNSSELIAQYEENRYEYTFGRNVYEDVTSAMNGGIQVKQDGGWGLATDSGSPVIPCIYDKVSTFDNGQVIVEKDGVISAVNADNNRVALLHHSASDFGNYSEDRVALLLDDGWHNGNGEFEVGTSCYEAIGTYTDGYVAVKENGRWGVMEMSGEWYIKAEYDEIILDELGRCYGQGAVFARQGKEVVLLVDGKSTGMVYEDAKPFGKEGYAAVKRNGLWGFIDTAGEVKINFQFDDALSFGQHLAAVKVDRDWGYVSLEGRVVIEPFFSAAKSFSNGSAPVCTVDGWEFITLTEYKGETTL